LCPMDSSIVAVFVATDLVFQNTLVSLIVAHGTARFQIHNHINA